MTDMAYHYQHDKLCDTQGLDATWEALSLRHPPAIPDLTGVLRFTQTGDFCGLRTKLSELQSCLTERRATEDPRASLLSR